MGRFSNIPTVQTRVGLVSDNLIEVGAVRPATFNRFQFMDITKSKNTSARDKLRDLVFYGFIAQNNNVYTITSLGHSIISGTPEQRTAAIQTAIKRNPVWNYIIEKTGTLNPSRDIFEKLIKERYGNVEPTVLENLWNAFKYDVSCTTKEPPFSDWLSAVRSSPYVNKTTAPAPVPVETPEQTTRPIITPESSLTLQHDNIQQSDNFKDKTKEGAVPTPSEAHNGGEWPNPGKVEYRGHVVVVTDDLTAKFAENLVKKMIKDLKRKGVEFDE